MSAPRMDFGEARGRAAIVLVGLMLLGALWGGCETSAASCREMCKPRAVKSYVDLWGGCTCDSVNADGGAR